MRCLPFDLALVALTWLGACSPEPRAPLQAIAPAASSQEEPSRTASPAKEKLAQLRTGEITVEELPTQTVPVVGQFEDERGWYAQLSIDPPENTRVITRAFRAETGLASEILGPRGALEVIVRVPRGAPHEVRGWLYVQTQEDRPQRVPVIATPASGAPSVSDLPGQWRSMLTRRFTEETGPAHPWHRFASMRLMSRASEVNHRPDDVRPFEGKWSELMATTTGAMALQSALQSERGLQLRSRQGKARIPLDTLNGPSLPDHPFPAMMSALPGPSSKRVESLAEAVPAEFWYLRWRTMKDLLRALDQFGDFGPGVPRILAGQSYGEDLLLRYRTQLGLPGAALAETFGPTLVGELALVGSDPYIREGTDVTLIFEAVDARAFELALVTERRQIESTVGPLDRRTIVHHGHTIEVHEDARGAVQQHVVVVGSRVLISNSLGATQKILDAIDGRVPKLSNQPDFAYMLARDPQPSAGFAFLGDRFISAVVGPEQKIKELRRQLALSELLAPGYAALLYGYLEGAPPADTVALVRSGLLEGRELRHQDGSPITFTPGTAARSKWGSPNALTPLIDLSTPSMVTSQERDAYRQFADEYSLYWQTFIDPIAVRLDIEDDAIAMDLRMLPLLLRGPIIEIASVVGAARVDVPDVDGGVQMALAVDPQAAIRRDLDRFAEQMLGGQTLSFGWLGDWVFLGSLDRAALTHFHQLRDADIQLPALQEPAEADVFRHLGALPLFAAAEVRNPAVLVATLVGLRSWVEQVAPGQLEWREFAKHGDVSIVRIGMASQEDPEMQAFSSIAVYYAIAPGALIVALRPDIVESMIDRFASGRRPQSNADSTMQATVEAAWQPGSPLATLLTWWLQGESNTLADRSRAIAEVLLRADPATQDPEVFKQRALAYLGAVPLTASGRYDFELDHGLVGDTIHGSALAPVFPALPVPGSPVQKLVQRISGLRADVALDQEPGPVVPPAMSLQARVRVQLQTP